MENPNPQENKEDIKPEYNENTSILKEKVMIALLRTEQGPAVFVRLHGREEIIMAKGEIDAFLTMKLIQGDIKSEQMRSGIIKPKGDMMGFARKVFHK